MSTDKRFELLEQRVATLEQLVRQLAGAALTESPRAASAGAASLVVPAPPAAAATSPPAFAATPDGPMVCRPLAFGTRQSLRHLRRAGRPGPTRNSGWGSAGCLRSGSSSWCSRRVTCSSFRSIAAGSRPLVRCSGGALAGIAVGAIGWRLHEKGLRTYGAALIGAGGAIVYLAVWAATRLYGFLPPFTGNRGTGAGVGGGGLRGLCDQSRGTGSHRGARCLLRTDPARQGSGERQRAAALSGRNGRRPRMGLSPAALEDRDVPRGAELLRHRHLGNSARGRDRPGSSPTRSWAARPDSSVGLREGWWETRLLSFAGGWGILGSRMRS